METALIATTPVINEESKYDKYDPSREVFIFSYKKGHTIISVHFQANNLAEAVKDCKEVCRIKKWVWIGVTPFLRDIKRMLNEE